MFSLSCFYINISVLPMCAVRIMEAWWLTSNKNMDREYSYLIKFEIRLLLKEEQHAHRCFPTPISTFRVAFSQIDLFHQEMPMVA